MTDHYNPHPANTLIARERIRGASRMIAPGTDHKDVTADQIDRIRDDVSLFCRSNKITRAALAKFTGYGDSVISEFLNGKYAGNNSQVAIDLEDWLVEEESRRANQQKTEFVWTNVAQQINAVARYCLDMKKVGLVYGPETSGIGKTSALQAIWQDIGPRRSAYITLDKCDANPTALLKKILGALRLQDSGTNAARFKRAVDALNRRCHILLIDQVHNLRFAKEDRPLYYLMDLYDATESAQLWAGTSDMVAYLTRQQTKTLDEPLAQIRRRIFPCVDLMESFKAGGDGGGEPLYTVDQIREMFSKFKLKLTPAGARYLTTVAHHPGSGGIGLLVSLMEYAVHIGEMRGAKSIDVPLIKEAMRCGVGVTRADWIDTEATHFEQVVAKTA